MAKGEDRTRHFQPAPPGGRSQAAGPGPGRSPCPRLPPQAVSASWRGATNGAAPPPLVAPRHQQASGNGPSPLRALGPLVRLRARTATAGGAFHHAHVHGPAGCGA